MEERERIGWIIVSTNHPNNKKEIIDHNSFDYKRNRAIEKFVKDTGADWNYWRKKYGFRAVKAKIKIELLEY